MQFLKRCREKGIHTILDTSGHAPRETLRKISEYTDLVFYDIKHMNPAVNKKLTGVSNKQTLKNLKASFSLAKAPIALRIPVIPGDLVGRANVHADAADRINIFWFRSC